MQTTEYRYRQTPQQIVEAVQYTRSNADDVAEWAPSWPYTGPDAEPGELTVQGPGERRRARYGTWIFRYQGTDDFRTCGSDAFDDYFEPA